MMKMPGLMILNVKSFLHGTSNFCVTLISYLGSKSFVVKNKRNNERSLILIIARSQLTTLITFQLICTM